MLIGRWKYLSVRRENDVVLRRQLDTCGPFGDESYYISLYWIMLQIRDLFKTKGQKKLDMT